jgi:hypothetical protein
MGWIVPWDHGTLEVKLRRSDMIPLVGTTVAVMRNRVDSSCKQPRYMISNIKSTSKVVFV